MPRKLLSTEELESWLTAELGKFEDCEECEVMAVMRLRKPGRTGCNWSSNLKVRATGVPQDILRPVVSEVIRRARAKFNIRPKRLKKPA
jgi:hypothetical protein